MGKMYEMLKTMKLLGGTGGTGPIDYDNLENLPTMNGNTIKGTMVGSDLGLQDELTTGQLAAVNSGITQERVGELEGIEDTGDDYITVGGIRLYVSSTAPTGDIPDGSVGVGW